MNPVYKKCFVRMVLFLLYAYLGGWLFSFIEKREEPYAVVAKRLMDKLKEDMRRKYNITSSKDFNEFVETVINASRLKNKRDWTFLTGCDFAFSALTTVGYGNVTPQTALGQGMTIIFCIIGLPITMLALKTAGEVVRIGLTTITVFIEKKILCRKNPEQKMLKSLLMVIFWIIVLICILATGEIYVNDWTFLEGVYCWFVTFTTIGFGDYIPFERLYVNKTDEGEVIWTLSSAVFTIPFIIGLCLISSFLNLLVDCAEKIKLHVNKVCSCAMCRICANKTDSSEIGEIERNDIQLKSIGFRRCSV